MKRKNNENKEQNEIEEALIKGGKETGRGERGGSQNIQIEINISNKERRDEKNQVENRTEMEKKRREE